MAIVSSASSSCARVLIFGTGSIGSVYSFILSRASCHVTTICRSNYSAVKSSGLNIQSTLFGNHICHPDIVASSVDDGLVQDGGGGAYDYVVVTSKSFPCDSNPSQAQLIERAVTPGKTTIALIQNGISIEQPYSTLFPHNPLLSCIVYLPVTQTEMGTFTHKEVELLHIGTYPSSAPPAHKEAASRFASLINAGGATAKLHDDVQEHRWQKLLANASWNPVCALTRCRDAEFLSSSREQDDEAAKFIASVMNEISLLAIASGYPAINQNKVEYQLSRAKARLDTLDKEGKGGVEPSMMADATGRRRMEVDAIVGNAVRIAERKGIGDQVPNLRALWVLSRALDESFYR